MIGSIQQYQVAYLDDMLVNNDLHIQGTFVAIEGLDGAGTSTQIARLANWLEKHGYNVVPTKEPTNGIWGNIIRGILRGEIKADPLSLCHAFMADRINHIQKLHKQTKLLNSPIVLSDRYQLSYLAYQQKDTNKSFDWLFTTQQGLPWPDLTIFLDVPPEICIQRMKSSRTTLELFENIEMLERIRDGYFSAIDLVRRYGQKIRILDGTRPVNTIHEDILAITLAILEKR